MKFENAFDFEKHIKIIFEKKYKNCKVTMADNNTKGYDLKLLYNRKKYALQVKNYKAKVHSGHIKKFINFLDENRREFKNGCFVSSSGYSKSVVTFLESNEIKNIILFEYIDNELKIFYKSGKTNFKIQKDITKKIYIGVFTSKGGVGKTTISAHLAGAFAILGYDVLLLDLDIQKNLKTLLGDGLYIEPIRGKTGTNITVLSNDEYSEEAYSENIVICDCNPELQKNPKELIEKFDYCLLPTTLNPLGINKNANVIERTFEGIRYLNKKANLFILINSFYPRQAVRNKKLSLMLESKFEELYKNDKNFNYINPIKEHIYIRFSYSLLYWGEHILTGEEPRLAFKHRGGRSYPREDFLSLAEHFINHTELDKK